jgi:hypothetical protein
MKSGGAGSELIQSKLEKLAEKKKEMEKELELAVQCEVNLSISSTAKSVIKSNIVALKAAMKKGQPHFKKRLFGNLFNQLLVTENGIKVFYELEEQSNVNGPTNQKTKPSDSKSDGISIFTTDFFRQTLGFLASNGSPVVTDGGYAGVEPTSYNY